MSLLPFNCVYTALTHETWQEDVFDGICSVGQLFSGFDIVKVSRSLQAALHLGLSFF